MSSGPEMPDTSLLGLAWEIVPGLFQGRRPRTASDFREYLEAKIAATVSLTPNVEIDFLPGSLKVLWPIEDGAMVPQEQTIRTLAVMISRLLDAGQKVLVCCDAGMNRSGLIVARTLISRGTSPERAIALIRERRDPSALSNPAFVNWLMQEIPAHR